nr:MAG TPA: hypothetical protein [Caudoviricetes sp.]
MSPPILQFLFALWLYISNLILLCQDILQILFAKSNIFLL